MQKVSPFRRAGVMNPALRAGHKEFMRPHIINEVTRICMLLPAAASLSLVATLGGVHAAAEWMDLGKVLMTAECCRLCRAPRA